MSDWIEWKGGECPVPPDTWVEIQFRNGETCTLQAQRCWWGQLDHADIRGMVAYRVVSEPAWIEWVGGHTYRPLPPEAVVEVQFRSGKTAIGVCCGFFWQHQKSRMHGSDIVAYRVVSEGPKAARPDMVNSPPHYTDGGIEAIDYIAAKLGPDGFKAYCVGNALKYISRAGKKGSAKEDLSKAIWYLRRAGGE